MIDVIHKYFRNEEDIPPALISLNSGCDKIESQSSFLDNVYVRVYPKTKYLPDKESRACVMPSGDIYARISGDMDADEWAHVIAHCILHLVFGHFDKDALPADLLLRPADHDHGRHGGGGASG